MEIARGFETLAVSSDKENKDAKNVLEKSLKKTGKKEKKKEINLKAESHLY